MSALTRNAALSLIGLLIVQSLQAASLMVPTDYQSIQAAIDAATASDQVLVAAGVYHERVRLKQGVTLRSQGDDIERGEVGLLRAEQTVIDGGGQAGEGAGIEMAEGSTLDGFTVRNVGDYDDDSWKKHFVTQGEQQAYEHIGAPGVAGIAATQVNCTIRNNIVHHVGYTGIGLTGSRDTNYSPLVTNNVCYRNMGGGIGAMNGSQAIIRGNVCFENFFAGIGHEAASPLVVGNVCYGNIRAGIGISEGSSPIVRGNKCYRNRRAGIGIRTGGNTQPLIEDNDCYENGMAGIGIREEAAPIIRGNRCYRNKLAGIGSRTKASPIIIGNECYENDTVGIGQQSDSTPILIDNYSHHNKVAGIGFDPCKAGKASVTNNRIVNNAKVAVGIQAGWNVRLSGNVLSRDGGLPPIVMVFEGAEASFTDNKIRGGGVAGIRAAGKVSVDRNEFVGTSLRKTGPPNFAVWALKGSSVNMSNNRIRGWRHGLHASEAMVVARENTVSNFHKAAFVIQRPTTTTRLVNNTAMSSNDQDVVVTIDGKAAEVGSNKLLLPTQVHE